MGRKKYKKKTRNNIFEGVMYNAQAGLKAGKYKTLSAALKGEHKKSKKLYGDR